MSGGDVEHPMFAMSPPTPPDNEFDSVVAFAFGNRLDENGEPQPGPINEQLAEVTGPFAGDRSVFAQWEVARCLDDTTVASIEPTVTSDGEVVHLSTVGVAERAVELAAESGTPLGCVAVIALADHAVRCMMTLESVGVSAAVPAGVALPAGHDADSGQRWTRDRASFIRIDLLGRAMLAHDSCAVRVAGQARSRYC